MSTHNHPLSSATEETLRTLETLSPQGLLRREDVGVLLELGGTGGREDLLNRLCFEAKFVSQTVRMLERLASVPEGIERLQTELSASLGRAGILVRSLVQTLDEEERARWEHEYLVLQPETVQHLITLCHDLRWYKNLQIDRSRGTQSQRHTRRPQ
jgi:hypothetical protein